MLVCDKCGANINAGSRFCAQCGDPVTEADVATTVASSPDGVTVQISFGYSSSSAYSKAVAICERVPSYVVTGEGKQIHHQIVLPLSEVELIINIFDLVGSWKSSQMLINGQSATKKDLTYYGVGCYRNRQKAYKAEAYCYGERQYDANIWGCKKLGMPVFEWGGGWLDYGQFDANGVWHFDKARIRHELEVSLKENELCPALNRARVFETLENLPESVDPKADKNWQYRTTYEDVKGDYKEVAVGIRPVLKKVNRYIIGGFKPEWEEESSPESATTIRVAVEPARTVALSSSGQNRREKRSYTWLWIILGIIILISLFR